eukprot:TRINITY_DN19514_c0_g1_i1.p1 TRINITY_DN19514_c0_g1~~TRINITY_DN19514_c0_g1_i1.p1  ORF type:complete len:217 (+),score=23.67 TRINITY_DN19514_c0_g1_i1:51-701(+)
MWSLFGKAAEEKDPKEKVRDWNRKLRQEMRDMDRSIRQIEMEEDKVLQDIKNAARRNDVVSCKLLAREIVRSRAAKNRLHESKAHMNSVSMSLQNNMATMRMSEHLKTSTDVMQSMNQLIRYPEVAKTMKNMATEMAKMGLIEEMVGDAVDSMDHAGIDTETDTEVHKVLEEVAAGVLSQLPDSARPAPKVAAAAVQEISQGDEDSAAMERRLNAL